MLEFEKLQNAIKGTAAAFRAQTKLQPAGGEGDKVFPPTYSGAVYATEKRRLPGFDDPVDCVLMDSVQSQANRIEEALQDALDEGRIQIPLIEVDFSDIPIIEPGEEGEGFYEPIGRVTSLQAPHRVADAILRDSEMEIDGKRVPFRETEAGRKIGYAGVRNATPLYEICPTALVLGIWDSTGPKGGLGTKVQRALVSEIIGVNASYGTKTSSRIDPLAIAAEAGPVYRHKNEMDWTLDPAEALPELKNGKPTGKVALYKKTKKGYVYVDPTKVEKGNESGKPSTINHSNIPPDIDWQKDQNNNVVWFPRKEQDGLVYDPQRNMWKRPVGGVTISFAEQMTVISLPALRRLQFPIDGKVTQEVNEAGRVVLAALGLCGAVLAAERGLDLRSRCLLWPTEPIRWKLLDRPGEEPVEFELDGDAAIGLLNEAVDRAESVGLTWMEKPLVLKPAAKLVELVRRSQELAIFAGDEGGE
ncbi:MAG: hypothetical protein KatS3mg111_3797 [Pirellulaceae bacterium]|nr:MAG: hypothetical protein KatS3mg111_3797 [Pirellulaceae bacterium]